MPLARKVVQLVGVDLETKFAQLHREHTNVLNELARDPRRTGGHGRSSTYGRAIYDAICNTHQRLATTIRESFTRALPFQGDEPLTVEELGHSLAARFEPQRSMVLEQSRQRLAEIDNGRFINEVVQDSNQHRTWLNTEAEHLLAEHKKTITAPPSQTVHVSGNIGALQLGSHAVAHVTQQNWESDGKALRGAIDQFAESLLSVHGADRERALQAVAITNQAKLVVHSHTPNPALLHGLLLGLSYTVQTISAAKPAWELIRSAARPLGIELPTLPAP
jgi:hypothetical protein